MNSLLVPEPRSASSAHQDIMIRSPSPHQPTSEFAARVPSAPAIHLPLPVFEDSGRRIVTINPPRSNPDPSLNVDFLLGGQPYQFSGLALHAWEYTSRREVQMIIPCLYVGPASAARKVEFLKKEGITMVYGIAPHNYGRTFTAGPQKAATTLGVRFEMLHATTNFELISQFPVVTRKINSHLAEVHQRAQVDPEFPFREGKVLIFCESGNQKSVVVAGAWLMETFENINFMTAMQILMSRRFCCDYDDNSRQILKNYDDILTARRQAGMSMTRPDQKGSKRGWEPEDNSDDMMDDDEDDDRERFEGRRSFAPFRDAPEATMS